MFFFQISYIISASNRNNNLNRMSFINTASRRNTSTVSNTRRDYREKPTSKEDIRNVQHNNHASRSNWDDEDEQEEPFVCGLEQMFSRKEKITLRPESDLRRIREKTLQHMLLAQRLSKTCNN
jgi:hypothetical protein